MYINFVADDPPEEEKNILHHIRDGYVGFFAYFKRKNDAIMDPFWAKVDEFDKYWLDDWRAYIAKRNAYHQKQREEKGWFWLPSYKSRETYEKEWAEEEAR